MRLEARDWTGTEFREDVMAPCVAESARHPLRACNAQRLGLTLLEQRVVAISLFDDHSSIDPPAGMARLRAWLFGVRPANSLADKRLEALRRYCVLLRLASDALPPEETQRLRAAGYSDIALSQAKRLIALSGSRH